MGARELHGHIKAERPGTVVKCSIKQEFTVNFPREPWSKLTDSKWMESSELAENVSVEQPPFQRSSILPEKVCNAAC